MSVKTAVRRQYARIIDSAAERVATVPRPQEGWIVTARKALGISAAQLARRAGVTRAAIYQAQRNEAARAITLRQMEKLAEAMGAQFVYAIVPQGTTRDVLARQATKKAKAIVSRAGAHMALEDQALPKGIERQEIHRLADELIKTMPADFWEDGEQT